MNPIFKNSIKLLHKLRLKTEKETDHFINVIFNNLVHTLLIFPDNPEKEPQELM